MFNLLNKTTALILTDANYEQYSRQLKETLGYKSVSRATKLIGANITESQIEALKVKYLVDKTKVETGTRTIKYGDREVCIDFANLKVATTRIWNSESKQWELVWRNVRHYSLLQYVGSGKVQCEELVSNSVVLSLLAARLDKTRAAYQADDLIAKVFGSILIESNTYGVATVSKDIMGEDTDLKTPEWYWENYKINPITIGKTKRTLELVPYEVNSGLTQTSYQVVCNALDNVSVVSDKQATKYLVYGPGAEAMGVYKVGNELVSYNPVEDTNKGANRIAAGNSKVAAISDSTFSNLKNKLSNGETTSTHGRMLVTLVAPGLALAPEGEAVTNNLDWNFQVSKSINASAHLLSLGQVPLSMVDARKVCQELREDLVYELSKLGSKLVLKHGDTINLYGCTIYRHQKHTEVTVVPTADTIQVIPNASSGFANKVTSVTFIIQGCSYMTKKNPKVRGEGVKATCVAGTSSNFKLEGGEDVQDWEILLHSESYKTVQKLMAMYANDQVGDVVVDGGRLYNDGALVSDAEFCDWLHSVSSTVTISRKVHNNEFEKGLLLGGQVTLQIGNRSICVAKTAKAVSIVDTDYSWIVQEVLVFAGISHFNVEVSTADENYGTSQPGVIEQLVLGTYHPELAKVFKDSASKSANKLSLVKTSGDRFRVMAEAGMELNLNEAEMLCKFRELLVDAHEAAKVEGTGIKGILMGLKSYLATWKYSSIRLSFIAADTGYEWVADLPIAAFIAFANFDSSGNPVNDYLKPHLDEDPTHIKKADSIVCCFLDLVSIFMGDEVPTQQSLIDSFTSYGYHLRSWLHRIQTSKIVKRALKGKIKFVHLKVAPSYELGGVDIPCIGFSSDNPIWKQLDISEGDNILATRMPFPTAVAAKAVVDNSIDRTMVSLSPIVMTRATAGDFDGDSLYILSPKQAAGLEGDKLAIEFNNSQWSLGGFDTKRQATFSELKPNKLAVKLTQIVHTTWVDDWTADLEKVQTVYRQFVGITYGWAFDATIKYFSMDHFSSQEEISRVKSVLDRWLSYEQDCLGGYSEDGYDAVARRMAAIKDAVRNGSDGSFKNVLIHNSYPTNANKRLAKRRGEIIHVCDMDRDSFSLQCAVGLSLAKLVLSGRRHPNSVDRFAITALAVRALTGKVSEDNSIFKLATDWGTASAYDTAIEALADNTSIDWTSSK